jgi:2-haloacid dehalogenase
LIFDTFGIVVDWRVSIIAEVNAWSKAKGVDIDWGSPTVGAPDARRRWRGFAGESFRGQKLDDLHRMILDELFMEFRMMPAMSDV